MKESIDSHEQVNYAEHSTASASSGYPLRPYHYAFLVGCQNYPGSLRLQTPSNDVRTLSSALKKLGFQVTATEDATAADLSRMFEQMETLVKRVPGDNSLPKVLFFFAGHGGVKREMAGDKKQFFGYLMPKDGEESGKKNLIDFQELVRRMEKLPCKHFLMLLDCCHSGAIEYVLHSTAQRDSADQELADSITFQRYHHYTHKASWQIITSASAREKANDAFGNAENSPFVHALKDALSGEADNAPRDYVIESRELYAYLRHHVNPSNLADDTRRQTVSLHQMNLHDQGEFLFELDGFNLSGLKPAGEFENPYMALKPYSREDAYKFFGRGREIERLLSFVSEPERNLTIVTGASGSGKSSLVMAGLCPKFSGEIAMMTPGANPETALNEALKKPFDWLIIDQFEEVITLNNDKEIARRFLEGIANLLTNGKKIILTLRSDFTGQIDKEPLLQWWEPGLFYVKALEPEDIREIIVVPSRRNQIDFHPHGLVDIIQRETQPNALPLLSFTLFQLCELCKNDEYWKITKPCYDQVGGVQGAIQRHATEVFEKKMNDGQREAARNIFLRMVTFQPNGDPVKKPVHPMALYFSDTQGGSYTQLVKDTLEILKNARLLLQPDGADFIMPTHDYLVYSWSKIHDWRREIGQDKLTVFKELDERVQQWKQNGRQGSDLLNRRQLKKYKGQFLGADTNLLMLNADELAMMQTSQQSHFKQNIIAIVSMVIVLFFSTLYVFSQKKTEKGLIKEVTTTKADNRAKTERVEISKLQSRIMTLGSNIRRSETLKEQENFVAAQAQLLTVREGIASAKDSILTRVGKVDKLPDSADKKGFQDTLQGFLPGLLAEFDSTAIASMEQCSILEVRRVRCEDLLNEGNLLEVRGKKHFLGAYQKFRQALAVGYPYREKLVQEKLEYMKQNLQLYYAELLTEGDTRVRAKRKDFAKESYKKAKEIARTLGMSTKEVEQKLSALQ